MPPEPSARLTSEMLVGALIRRAMAEGGFSAVVAKGDAISGVILIQAVDRGREIGLFERVSNFTGGYALMRCGPSPEEGPEALAQYMARRRKSDPDLWIVELDIPNPERFAEEIFCDR